MLSCQWQHWGFLGFQKKQVIFNARCESVIEKPTFHESILHRRVVIPGACFDLVMGQLHTLTQKLDITGII